MSQYVDGFVVPVPKDQLDKYRQMSEKAGKIWKEYGALDYREWVGDDLNIEGLVSFTTIIGAKEDETVVFAWITYNSREHRDEVNAKVMADPRMDCAMETGSAPFDCKRMAYGGFTNLVTA